ncbi:ABC transporter permease subunit [Clostridium sp. MCC353]|uniref:carbohydrate ABC transporter permease n=1 Tax=Clostridium sp. MCC353 TaxID=2592646 RepID=UPI001C00EB85|nr:carbohydrate ABC transporter permease [Clostridium sp. MCC353]MBT9778655.1 ABC transporter permease subunit [Clostridium sp. MCC353]
MQRAKIKQPHSDKVFGTVVAVIVAFAVFITLYPLIFVLSASISSPMEVFQGNVWLLPKGINFEAYKQVFLNKKIWTGYRNTIFYTCLGTMIATTLSISAAYPLARRKLYGKKFFMTYFMITMFFNGGMVPTYLIVQKLGLYDTVWAVILVNMVTVYNIIVAKTYIQSTIPEELYEAAEIDGCGDIRVFFKVVLPLSAPILAVLTLFYGVAYWNNYFNGLIYVGSSDKYPLQLILRDILLSNATSEMIESMETDINKLMVSESLKYAVVVVSSVPMLILYPFLQKFFVKGVMIGSVKG